MIGRMMVRCVVGICYFLFFGAAFLAAGFFADVLAFASALAGFLALAFASTLAGFFGVDDGFLLEAFAACFSAARVACSSSGTTASAWPSAPDSISTTSDHSTWYVET